MRISDWSSDVCSSDLAGPASPAARASGPGRRRGSCAPPLMREIIIAKPEEQHQRADAVAGERVGDKLASEAFEQPGGEQHHDHPDHHLARDAPRRRRRFEPAAGAGRSEEHTSELQSLMRISYAVCCLKKK